MRCGVVSFIGVACQPLLTVQHVGEALRRLRREPDCRHVVNDRCRHRRCVPIPSGPCHLSHGKSHGGWRRHYRFGGARDSADAPTEISRPATPTVKVSCMRQFGHLNVSRPPSLDTIAIGHALHCAHPVNSCSDPRPSMRTRTGHYARRSCRLSRPDEALRRAVSRGIFGSRYVAAAKSIPVRAVAETGISSLIPGSPSVSKAELRVWHAA